MTMFTQFVLAFAVARVLDRVVLEPLGGLIWERGVMWAWRVATVTRVVKSQPPANEFIVPEGAIGMELNYTDEPKWIYTTAPITTDEVEEASDGD
jgi:hypothetical protein